MIEAIGIGARKEVGVEDPEFAAIFSDEAMCSDTLVPHGEVGILDGHAVELVRQVERSLDDLLRLEVRTQLLLVEVEECLALLLCVVTHVPG